MQLRDGAPSVISPLRMEVKPAVLKAGVYDWFRGLLRCEYVHQTKRNEVML